MSEDRPPRDEVAAKEKTVEEPAPVKRVQAQEKFQERLAAQEKPVPAKSAPPAAKLALAPAKEEKAKREEKTRPAFVSGLHARAEVEQPAKGRTKLAGKLRGALDGSTSQTVGKTSRKEVAAATTPSTLKRGNPNQTLLPKIESSRVPNARWMIQLGATEDAGEATALLAKARSEGHVLPASAKAFTEKVQKGRETLYRARFAGMEEQAAAAACKSLKRSGFSCFATKN